MDNIVILTLCCMSWILAPSFVLAQSQSSSQNPYGDLHDLLHSPPSSSLRNPAQEAPTIATSSPTPSPTPQKPPHLPQKMKFSLGTHNWLGVHHFWKKQYRAAQESFLEALAKEHKQFLLYYNLGCAFLEAHDIPKAKQEFLRVLQGTQSPILRFLAAFNLGVLFTQEKNIEKALEYYQSALDTSLDDAEESFNQVRVNIELLTRQQQSGGDGESQNSQQQNEDSKENKKYKDNPQHKIQKPQELTEQDIRDILEEMQQQEKNIWLKMQQDRVKQGETNLEKDW